jgi:hypothetical protein
MEDVLRVYERPLDPARPLVCLDESSRQLVAHSREPLPPRPGEPERWDYEYVRNGVADVFVCFAPLLCERHVRAARTRTRVDLAETLRWVSDELYPQAETIVLVWDNLNTHSMGSLYEAFPPEEAERLASRFEAHHTPRHGSWLDMAEVEIGCLMRHGLPARVADYEEFERLVKAWEDDRNARARTVEWRFTVGDARHRLSRLYPKIELDVSVK